MCVCVCVYFIHAIYIIIYIIIYNPMCFRLMIM